MEQGSRGAGEKAGIMSHYLGAREEGDDGKCAVRLSYLEGGVEILIFGAMPIRVSESPQSDLSELSAMERRDDAGINRTVSTVASAFQPDPTSAL